MQLRWQVSFSASCLYAAARRAGGAALVDQRWASSLQAPVEALTRLLGEPGRDAAADRLWGHLVPLSAEIDNNRQLAEVTLRKAVGGAAFSDVRRLELENGIAGLEAAVRQAQPDLQEQLAARIRPLREQWEARGPGMLLHLGRLCEAALLVEAADVVLVHPAQGGGGVANLLYNSVFLEAVLANPVVELPETVRLAWLLAQLNNDLPSISENVPGDRLTLISNLAMLPPTLLAGQHVELCRYDFDTLQRAIDVWGVTAAPSRAAEVVMQWWLAYQQQDVKWSIAFQGLHHMLGDEVGPSERT